MFYHELNSIEIIEAELPIYAPVIKPSVVQVMACRLVGANDGILLIGPLGTKISEILKQNSYIFIQEKAKDRLQSGGHYVLASMCWPNYTCNRDYWCISSPPLPAYESGTKILVNSRIMEIYPRQKKTMNISMA